MTADFRSSLDASVHVYTTYITWHCRCTYTGARSTDLHRSYVMIAHVHALVSLAASAVCPDEKLEPNVKRQTTGRCLL